MKHLKVKISIFLNYFVFAILLNSVGTVILQVQKNYGVSESSASALEAFKDLSIAIMSFLVASFITRIGYKKAMLVALGAITIACVAMPSFNSFAITKVLFAITGISFALIKVSIYSTIGLITDDSKEHVSMMNFIEAFFMIGILTGYFIFGAFIDDNSPQSTEWLKVYYILAGLTTVAFLLLLSTPIDESMIKNDSKINFKKDFEIMLSLIGKQIVLIFIVSAFIYVLIEQSIMSWLPTFNNKVLHLPTSLSIQMASILAASTALGRFLAGIILKKFQWLLVLIVCLVASAILVLVAIPLAQNVGSQPITSWSDAPLVAFIFPLIGLFIAPIYPAINSVILNTLPAKQHAPMSGLIVVFSALGGTTGSIITGNIFQHFGGEVAFYFSLIPMAILTICLVFFNKLDKANSQMSYTLI